MNNNDKPMEAGKKERVYVVHTLRTNRYGDSMLSRPEVFTDLEAARARAEEIADEWDELNRPIAERESKRKALYRSCDPECCTYDYEMYKIYMAYLPVGAPHDIEFTVKVDEVEIA